MDMNIVNGVVSVILLALVFVSALIQWWWYKREGSDERGKLITLKSTYIMCGSLVTGMGILFAVDGSLDLSKALLKLSIISILGLSFVAGSLSLLVLRKKY